MLNLRRTLCRLLLFVPAALVASSPLASPAQAQTILNDGETHVINGVDSNWYWVTNVGCTFSCFPPSGAPTHLRLENGGQAIGLAIEVFGDSTVTVDGGLTSNIEANDYAEVFVDSGTVMMEIKLNFGAKATITGGTVEALWGKDFGETTISGGFVNGGFLQDSHRVTVTGGQYYPYALAGNSHVTISGSDGLHHNVGSVSGNAVVEVVGSGFQVNRQVVPYGLIQATEGMVEGVLENDNSFNSALIFEHNTSGATGQVFLVAGSRDTDADMLDDDWESSWGGDPGNPDTDGDGLLDGWEAWVTFTLVGNPDSDGDTISDGDEIANNTDPLDSNDPGEPATSPPTVPGLGFAGQSLMALCLAFTPGFVSRWRRTSPFGALKSGRLRSKKP
jgi:hypothetical protein